MAALNSDDYYQDLSWSTQEEAQVKAVEEEYERQRRAEAAHGEHEQNEEGKKKRCVPAACVRPRTLTANKSLTERPL